MLLTPSDLGASEATLRTAEALVAAAIGTTTLEARSVTQTGYLDGQLLTLREGPASNLEAILFNGVPLLVNPLYPGPRLSAWSLDFQPYYSHFSLGLNTIGFGWLGYPYSVTYTAGWQEDNLPEAVLTAVQLTCDHLNALAGLTPGLVSERLGDVANTYSASGVQVGLSPVAASLLAPYARLRF